MGAFQPHNQQVMVYMHPLDVAICLLCDCAPFGCTVTGTQTDGNCRTMAGIHTFVVRTAVKAGMYTLPTREVFLKSLGEAGDHLSAYTHHAPRIKQRPFRSS